MTTLPTAYFPPISYIYEVIHGQAQIECHENYQKRSVRNKTTILTSQGMQVLSIPLSKGKHNRKPISEVTIAYDEPWYQQHLDTIETAYRSAPYFNFYIDHIEQLITSKEQNLFIFNDAILHWIRDTFSKGTRIRYTTEFQGVTDPAYYKSKPYRQVYEQQLGFVGTDLSILDLIFNVGYEIPLYFSN